MNKKTTTGILFVSLSLALLGGACVSSALYGQENSLIEVRAEEGDITSTTSEETNTSTTTSDTSTNPDYWKELEDKIEELRDRQIFGTTLGAIVGALVGAVISLVPSLLNRSNIKKAIEEVALTKRVVDNNISLAKDIQSKFDITDENYNKVIKYANDLSTALDKTNAVLNTLLEKYEVLEQENKDLKEILLQMASHSKELVANGLAEQLNKSYSNNNK